MALDLAKDMEALAGLWRDLEHVKRLVLGRYGRNRCEPRVQLCRWSYARNSGAQAERRLLNWLGLKP